MRLAVDVGSVRIGVARSDPGGLLATPLETLRRGRGDLERIAAVAAGCGAIEVIVGLPTSLSGREGTAARAARTFASQLAALIPGESVRLFDERFTTVTAHDGLRMGGKGGRARRRVVDQAAAVVLLQAALDAERLTGSAPGEMVPGIEHG